MLTIAPTPEYDEQNEWQYREEARRRDSKNWKKTSDLVVPFGKRLAFTSEDGDEIFFGYNSSGQFTFQQNASTPVSMASISYVTTVETTLTTSIASLSVDVTAANAAAVAAASSASSAATSATAAGTYATAANTSATNAATEASNASTSASSSSTSATNAAGSAATATTQATNAATSATNAGNSATAASGSASTAATQATAAGTSASAANTSATNAATQASNAATSATAASTSAGSASTSASSASTSASNAAGSASSAATSATNAASSETSAGNSASAASTSASTASTQATNAGTSASNAATSASNAATSATAAGGSATAASGSASTASTQATNAGNSATAAAASAVTASSQATNSASSASAAATEASNASTSASGAATSASAAATSATTATTQASNASTSASSASTSAGNAASSATSAATQASNAAGSASSAATSASSATASATAASSSATLSATYASGSQGSINSSATFADNAVSSGAPTNWSNWANAGTNVTRVTGLSPQPYAIEVTAGAGVSVGITQSLFGKITAGWHVLEADVTLLSGDFAGAGVLMNSDMAEHVLSFSTDTDITGSVVGAGTTGKLYRFRKLVLVTLGTTYNSLYAMNHYSSHGSVAAANGIRWHRCAIRAASQAEIEARAATTALVTTNANVATNTSAIATETSARAAADTTLRATLYGRNDTVIPDSDMRDSAFWNLASGCTFGDADGGWRMRRQLVFSNGTYDQYSQLFPVEPGATYRIRCRIWNNGGSWSGYFHPLIHMPNYAWYSLKHGNGVDPSTHDATNGIVAAGDTGEIEWTLTNPTGVTNNANREWQFRFYGSFTGGPVVVTVEIVRLDQYAAVTTNTSAVATINGAAAFWETVVSASGGDLSAVRLKAGASGSYIELISTVLRLANVSNGAVIEVMRAVSGEAYFSRPISSDSASRRLTIGPGYGVSGQEVVLWFGPNTTAPTSQSRTNGYFALGTDGKIYFGSSDLAVITTPMNATISAGYSATHGSNTTPTINVSPSVSSITNGSGSYTYRWQIVDMAQGIAPVITNGDTATATLYRSNTLPAASTYEGTASCTITDSNGKQVVKYFTFLDASTI